MPLHMDIAPLHRLVVIVARGHISAEEIADVTQGERPIQLFRSLHEARAWLDRSRQEPERRVG